MQVTDTIRDMQVSYELQDYTDELIEAIEYADSIDDLEDRIHELADAKIDIYNHDLLQWLAEDNSNVDYVDAAIDEGLVDPSASRVIGMIQAGQYKCHYEKFTELLDEYREELERIEAEEEAEDQ